MVASSRDIIDPAGRIVLRNVGLAGLGAASRGERPSADRFTRREHLRRTVLRAAATRSLDRDRGLARRPGYLIDQATYSRVLLDGDLVALPGPLAAFR